MSSQNKILSDQEHQQLGSQYLDKDARIKIMWENLLTRSNYKYFIDRQFPLDLVTPDPKLSNYSGSVPNAGGKGPSVTGPYGIGPSRVGPINELSMFENIQAIINSKDPSNTVNVEEIANKYSGETIQFDGNCRDNLMIFINRIKNLTTSELNVDITSYISVAETNMFIYTFDDFKKFMDFLIDEIIRQTTLSAQELEVIIYDDYFVLSAQHELRYSVIYYIIHLIKYAKNKPQDVTEPEDILLQVMYQYISKFVSYKLDEQPYFETANQILAEFSNSKDYNYYELIIFVEKFFDQAKEFINSHLGVNQMTFDLFVEEINNLFWNTKGQSIFFLNSYNEEERKDIVSRRGGAWQKQIEQLGKQQQSAGKKNNIVRRKNVGKLSRKQKHKQRKYKKTNKKYN